MSVRTIVPLVVVVVYVPVRRPSVPVRGEVSEEGADSTLLPVAVELEADS